VANLKEMIRVLRPLHQRLGATAPGDGLSDHPEKGQPFKAYLASDPVLPTAGRRTICVQPLGTFTAGQHRLLDQVVEGMGLYLCLPVAVLPPVPASAIPGRARRRIRETGEEQFLTSYILEELLEPGLPDGAAASIALTATDLWPGEGWNFVFGEASVRDRVGVWSLARLGDGASGPQVLIRALGTAVHETCHMFSMRHCTAYECAMCGSNSLEEGDRHPLWLCPQCLAKLCYATGADPLARYRALEGFCRRNGLRAEARFYHHSLRTLERDPSWRPGAPEEPGRMD
jgi:archaemetzincin